MNKKAHQSYQRVRVTTSDPTKIVVMLYEGAIRNLNQALNHFKEGRKVEASDRIKKTLDIIHYLSSTLDPERGGEIAANLQRLYDYVRDVLAEANITGDAEKIHSGISVLRTLLEAWQEIVTRGSNDTQTDDLPAVPPETASLRMVG